MRLLASLTAAAALALTAVPSDAYEKTVHVPYADCEVGVQTPGAYVGVDRHGRSARVERWGEAKVWTDC